MTMKMKIKPMVTPSLFRLQTDVGTVTFLSLFFPFLFETAMNMVLNTVNTAIISGFSENAAAAVGACAAIINMLLIFQMVVSLGVTVLLSNSIGAKDLRTASRITYTGTFVSVAISCILLPVTFLLAPQIMELQNLDGEIFSIATGYFRIRMCFLFGHAITSYLLAVLRCYGHSRYTFTVGIINNVLNLSASLLAVNLSQSTPESAAKLMAFGCGIANVITFVYVIRVCKSKGIQFLRPETTAAFFGIFRRILNIGIPSAVSNLCFTLSQIVTTAFIASIGDYALTAKVIYTQILSYAYLFSCSAGSANAILVGIRYGAKEFPEMIRMNRELSRLTRLINLSVSLLILALRVPILHAFTQNKQIFAAAVGVFIIDIFIEQGRAYSHVYEYALRSVGDVWASLVALSLSCVVFGIGLSYLCTVHLGFGIAGCWIGLAADECFRGIFTYFRWKVVLKRRIAAHAG